MPFEAAAPVDFSTERDGRGGVLSKRNSLTATNLNVKEKEK